MSWTTWDPAPAILAVAVAALVLFAQGFVRLRRRGRADLVGVDRALLFSLGVAVAAVALVSPLDTAGDEYLLSAHMLQHVLIGDVAPALLVVAVRGPLAFFLLPCSALRVLARGRVLRRVLAGLLRPSVSFGVWALAIGLWHIPAAYDYVLTHPLAHDFEHLTFMLGGVLVWVQLVDPARRRALGRPGRLAFAACMFVAAAALANLLLVYATPLYPSYARIPDRLFGLSPLEDQQLAGLVMLVEQALSLGACAAFLLCSPGQRGAAARARAVTKAAPRLPGQRTTEPRPVAS